MLASLTGGMQSHSMLASLTGDQTHISDTPNCMSMYCTLQICIPVKHVRCMLTVRVYAHTPTFTHTPSHHHTVTPSQEEEEEDETDGDADSSVVREAITLTHTHTSVALVWLHVTSLEKRRSLVTNIK